MIKNFITPDNFKNNLYGWATNQISHSAVPAFMCLLISPYANPIYYVLGLWILIELIQLIFLNSKLKDTIEDCVFEIFGVVLFVNFYKYVYYYITLFLCLFFYRLYKAYR